jgi:intein/homing endonuclease
MRRSRGLGDVYKRQIEDVRRGDIVHTLDGEKMVTDVWDPETLEFGEPECYEVTFEDGSNVICSGQHPFLTESGWVDAEDLISGNTVLKL